MDEIKLSKRFIEVLKKIVKLEVKKFYTYHKNYKNKMQARKNF